MLRQGYTSTATVTRPNDTTAYGAADVIGAATNASAALTFGTVGPQHATVSILSVSLMIEASALIASEADYTLHLYSQTPPSAIADNEAFDLESGDRDYYLGSVAIGTPVDLGATLFVQANTLNHLAHLKGGSTVYGYLVTDAAYTPTAERVYRVTIHSVV